MDIIHPEIFSDSLFLATNIRFWTQIKGNCVDTSYSCTKDADCKSLFKDKCLNGSCSSYGWCGQTNDYTIKYDISDNMLIWVRSFIQFAEFESSPSI